MSSATYQWLSLGQMWLALIISAAISVCYFLVLEAPRTNRLLSASQGILLLLAAAYAIAVSPWSDTRGQWGVPFLMLLALSLVSFVYSLFQNRGGSYRVYGCQLLFLPTLAWIFLVGAMTISHDWF